jgi:YHS domain-containing protein
MNKSTAILYKYPNLVHGIDFDNMLQDDGTQKITWKRDDIPEPSDADLESWNLDALKNELLVQLNQECSSAILGKFPSVVDGVTYYFSNDNEAQKNFDKMARAFDKGYVTEKNWTVYDQDGNVLRVSLNTEKFEAVYKDHLTHISSNVSKFRDTLMPQVLAATDEEEIQSIVW